MLTREQSNEVNEKNKIQYAKHRDSFLDDRITLFCILCGTGCRASDSTSHRGNNLICTNCIPSYYRLKFDDFIENPDYFNIMKGKWKSYGRNWNPHPW